MAQAIDPLSRLHAAAAAHEAAGLRRALRPRGPGPDSLIDLASNDYLGFARHPQVITAAAEAAHEWGTGATGSRLVTGSTTLHGTLEQALACFLGCEAALVFSSGYLANVATVTALAAALSAVPPPLQAAPPTPPQAVPHTPQAAPPTTPQAAPPTPPQAAPPTTPQAVASITLPGPTGTPLPPLADTPPRAATPSPRGAAGTLVISDALNHASLVDACRLARARVEIVGHQDVPAIERALAQRKEPAALVVTESAFSVGGPVAPLPAMHRAARAHGAILVIDEAHALGVVGPGGRGAAWQAGIAAEPDVVRTVSLSKALGAQGGAVLGAGVVIETLVSTGRAFIFDTALAPPSAAAALAALRMLERTPDLPRRAHNTARTLATAASELGLQTSPPGAAVVKVVLGEPRLALTAQRICADHGLRVGCFRPPSVPAGESCLRLTARANLTSDDIAAVSYALAAVRDYVRSASPVGRN